MSDYERNKGKLIPYNGTIRDLELELGKDIDINDFAYDTDGNYEIIKGRIYKVEWEVDGNKDDDLSFADVKTNSDGSIDFHTIHHNGCAYWTEVVESALKEKAK